MSCENRVVSLRLTHGVSDSVCSVQRERERKRRVQCTVSLIKVISVLTQWGGTLVIKIRERRERESHTSGDINKV